MGKSVSSLRVRPRIDTIAIGNQPENRMGNIGNIVMLRLADLQIAPYQKELNIPRIEQIVKKFDINRMRPIEVSYRDGQYWVFDGQHRANAYYILGYTEIPAIVHYGLTYEDEAYLFARQQEEVGSINSCHKWNALVEAKDNETIEIVKLCRQFGFTVLAKNNKGNNIKCVARLRKFYKEHGATKLMAVLMAIKNAWDYMPHSVDYPIFDGISRLVETYPEFDYGRLAAVLHETTPRLVLRDMEDEFHAVRGEGRRAAFQIMKLYNYKLPKRHRLEETLLK